MMSEVSMSETYEEILRRNEPKNYTVSWRLSDGSEAKATYFQSFEQAQLFASEQQDDGMKDVRIMRSGRHPNAPRRLSPEKRVKKPRITRTGDLVVNEAAWALPAGFVDGDADKHGPKVDLIPSKPGRTDREKAEWARNYTPDEGLLGFRAI